MEQNDKQLIQAASLPTYPSSKQNDKEKNQQFISQYHDEYQRAMSDYHIFSCSTFYSMITTMSKQRDIQYRHDFCKQLTLTSEEESINKEVIILRAEWGHFSMTIKILNIQGNNTKHVGQINQGVYGNIYSGLFNRNKFVIKCLPIISEITRYLAVKEWFLMKIASLAGVGPKVVSYFGFDLLMFEQCIQFAMEECQPITVHNSTLQHFYENLSVLHKLHIVHQDIKPENIMYSSELDRPVFIDFGLSTIIAQDIGSKTMSNYVGSIDYWGPQMAKCFAEKSERPIDLYYNDLYGLDKTIQKFKKVQSLLETEDLFQKGQLKYISYLNLALGKYYMYRNHFAYFIRFFNQIVQTSDCSTLNFYESQFLLFFQELSPTREVKQFFRLFISEKHKQTPLYSKLNILYEVSSKNICSMQIFRRQDKYNLFSCRQSNIITKGKQIIYEDSFNQSVANFMQNDLMIKQVPYIKYLRMYLDYTSYVCDWYKVNQNQRRRAVKVYYKLFINNESQLEGQNDEIIKTIEHALKWCLDQDVSSSFKNQLPYLLLKIFDFIVILDLGTYQQFTNTIDKIYQHHSLTSAHKKIFVMRVEQSKHLNLIRLNPKGNLSRYCYLIKIIEWISNKRKQFSIMQKIQLEQFTPQFQKQFAIQTIQSALVEWQRSNIIEKDQKWIEIYYKVIAKNKKQKIMYFFPLLYRNSPHHRQNIHFCNQINNIFNACIRDTVVMSQFIFQFEASLTLNKLSFDKDISINELKHLNEILKQVNTRDLSLLDLVLIKMWNKILNLEYSFNVDVSFLYKKDGFIRRFFDNIKEIKISILANKNIEHSCLKTIGFYRLLFFSKKFQEQIQKEIKTILWDQALWQGHLCVKCERIRFLMDQVDQLHHFFLLYAYNNKNKGQSPTSKDMIDHFFRIYNKFVKEMLYKQYFQFGQEHLIQRGLLYGQLFCSNSPTLEQKYSGKENYYNFVKKTKMLFYYFQAEEACQLRYLMELMKQKSSKLLAQCLFTFSQFLAQANKIKWYQVLRAELLHVMSSMKEQDITQLFVNLRQLDQQYNQNKSSCPYILLIYICIFLRTKTVTLLQEVHFIILHSINRLHYRFRRQIAISLYGKYINSTLQLTSSKRQWLNYKNKIVKLLMIDGHTTQRKQRSIKGNIFESKLKKNINKIQVWNAPKPPLKFSGKK